jgi:60 kDa SS-A/Ro ribonucleoprotein
MSGVNAYLQHIPQGRPLPGREHKMVRNAAGGYVFPVDDWVRYGRWLILGSTQGTWYATPGDLTRANLEVVQRCLAVDGRRFVEDAVRVSTSGQAPKNDQAILALAMAARSPIEEVRRLACAAEPRVCRTGTDHLAWVEAVKRLGGARPGDEGLGRSSPMIRKAMARWYWQQDPEWLAFQLVKYRRRGGTWRERPSGRDARGGRLRERSWTHADVLRLCRPLGGRRRLAALAATSAPWSEVMDEGRRHAVLRWTLGRPEPGDAEVLPRIVAGFEACQAAPSPAAAARVIREARLPHEAVPDQLRQSPEVWEALLDSMPLRALLRNLPKLTRVGLLAPGSQWSAEVCRRVTDAERLRRARVHPMSVLLALWTYQGGHSLRGDTHWTPDTQVVDALDAGFYAAFGAVEPTGRRIVVGVDVSPSMMGRAYHPSLPNVVTPQGELPIQPRVVAAAMALVLLRTEPHVQVMAFDDGWQDLAIHGDMRIADVLRETERLRSSGTDCAQPLLWARQHRIAADAVVVLTDNETWRGSIHPTIALRVLRESCGLPTALVSCAFAPTENSIADPEDARQLNLVGLDTNLPRLIAGFIAG